VRLQEKPRAHPSIVNPDAEGGKDPSQRPTRWAIDNSPQYRGMLGNDDKRRIMKTSDSDMAVTVIGRRLMSTLFVYLVSEETPS
jgi:hypothetical protein